MIYLDAAATTKVSKEVVEAMLPYFTEQYGNPGSVHTVGRKAARAVARAREQIARTINADPEQIIFTSGGSEANTMALLGVAEYLMKKEKTHIIVSSVEHHSVLSCIKQLFDKGFEITYLPTYKNGWICPDDVRNAIKQNTGLVSVMTVNNEIGNLYDVDSIADICKENGVLFHTDFVQAYGNIDVDVNDDCANVDFLSVSGHKIHAPKGIGFLYAKDKSILSPVVQGGGQEFGLRGGTENVPYIVGLGIAAEIAYTDLETNNDFYKNVRELFIKKIKRHLDGVHENGAPFLCSKIVNLTFDGVDGETLLLLLDAKGVSVSAGSACSAHSAVPSHVLTAIGLTDKQARSSIRISFPDDISFEEVGNAADIIIDSVKQLREG